MPFAAIYCRISNDREGRELGVERQEQDCRALAARLGLEVVEVYTDNDISASTRSRKPRPAYRRMLQDARDGRFSTVLAYTSGRITRRPRENEDLIELAENHGSRFHYVASPSFDLNTAAGRRVARILAANDAGEAEDISERVSRAARQRAETARFHGGVPVFGLRRVDGRVEPDPVNAQLVREAATRVLRGESLYSICEDWNERGIRTTRGNRWLGACLRRALVSASQVGKREHRGKLHDAPWPAVLDRDVWERVRALVAQESRRGNAAVPPHRGRQALSGIAHCVCGARLHQQVNRGVVRIICHRQATNGCGQVTIPYEPLEEFVLDMVLARLDSPSFQAALRSRSTTTVDLENELRDELAATERRRLGVAEALEVGALTKVEAAERVRELRDERARLQSRLAELARETVLEGVESAADARTLWESASVDRRRRFLATLVAEVVVKPFPVGVPLSLRRKRDESEEDWCARHDAHRRLVLRERVIINWRR